jgi:hypothetical protein
VKKIKNPETKGGLSQIERRLGKYPALRFIAELEKTPEALKISVP